MLKNWNSRRVFYGSFFVLILGTLLLFLGSVVNSPDRVLVLEQQAVSKTSPAILDQALRNVINWPDWFHATWDVSLLDAKGQPLPMTDQTALVGSLGRILVSTKPRPKPSFPHVELQPPPDTKAYIIGFVITQYTPERLLSLRITQNTAIRITNLFDQIEWRIELAPEGTGTRIKGSVRAHTAHWRSRLFGILIPRYFLQQVFLPSAEKLAAIDRPLPPNPN